MNIVKPFKGITYNKIIIKDLAQVLTPPYDIINPKMQEELYDSHPYNFIRIDYGKKLENDDANNNVYTRAKTFFERWLKENILIKDLIPSFYLLVQDFTLKNNDIIENYRRIGFFGIYKLTEFSNRTIMPHEKTQSAPKEDRYLLTKTCGAYFSAVFSIYEDQTFLIENLANEIIKKIDPYFEFYDYQNVKNILFKIDNKSIIDEISNFMKNKPLYIADGHHRYETALRISKDLKYLNNESTDYTIMYFTNLCSESLKILPTHRILHNFTIDKENLKNFLQKYFYVKEFDYSNIEIALKELDNNKQKHAFLIVLEEQIILITLKDINLIDNLYDAKIPSVLKKLDVNILYYAILKNYFQLCEEDLKKQRNISYEKDFSEVVNKIKNGSGSIGFILNSTDVKELVEVANLGETMPQKSTYFYPKIPSGAVIYSFNDENF